MLVLEFYEGNNYVPIIYQKEDLISEEINLGEIDLAEFIGDFGKEILSYQVCFNKEITVRNDVPAEDEFPFKDFDQVQVGLAIGPQPKKASIHLNDSTGRDGLRVEDGHCEDFPGTLLNFQGELSLTYSQNHLYQREFFDRLKNEGSIVTYKPHPKLGERYAAAITEDFQMIIRPKQIWIWRIVLFAVFMSAWIGLLQLIRSSFPTKKAIK